MTIGPNCETIRRLSFCVVLLLGAPITSIGDAQEAPSAPIGVAWSVEQKPGKLILKERNQPLGIFHYQDPDCLRPFFSGARTVPGTQVTRNYPPVVGVDPDDHASMHCGIWLAFGDINGEDFWRNKARIEHKRFSKEPSIDAQGISFACEDQLVDSKGNIIGDLEQDYRISRIDLGYRLVWTATIKATHGPLVLGDQEEMGLGVRVATGLTEKNGGKVSNSDRKIGAKETWGKPAAWVDYSKTADGRRIGVLLIPDSQNFKPSWFHNRDYGLMVANSFGNKAFTQGEASAVKIETHKTLTLTYRIYWYECPVVNPLPIDRIVQSR